MPSEEASSRLVVYGAIAANLFIACTKIVAALVSGSSAMFSEGIHSIVDAGNDSLLLLGIRLSRRPPDEDHPLGYGREIYFWGLIVAMILFGIGGGLSVYEGIHHLAVPSPMSRPVLNYVVLLAAGIFEGASLMVGVRELKRRRGTAGIWQAVLKSKDPSLFVVIFEDGAAITGLALAFLGIFLSHLLRIPALDGVSSICIGALLSGVSVFLSYKTKGLLVGESASSDTVAAIARLVDADPAVEKAHPPLAVHVGPREIALALDIHFRHTLSATAIAHAIDRLERTIRAAHPDVKHIFIEADAIAEELPEELPKDDAAGDSG